MRTYEKYKDSGISWIGKVPEDWEIRRIKYIGYSENGLTYSPNDITKNAGVLVLRSSNIQNNRLAFDDNVYVKAAPKKLMLHKGDIIICSRNGSVSLIGKSALIEDDMNATFGAFMLRFHSNYNSKYIYYLVSDAISKYKGLFATTTINQLTKSAFASMHCAFAPNEEQEAIANYLDKKTAEIDKIIAEREKKIVLLNELKSSIISRTVTKGINPNAKMKDSGIDWFPLIPCNWEYSSLRHVCKKITDGSHFSPMSQLEGKPYITVTNVRNNKVYVEEALKISDEDFKALVSTGCQPLPGDILLSKDGTVGRTAIVTSNDYVVLSSLGILRPSSLVDSKYLEYCLNSNALQMQMQMMMDGSALRRITIKKICNLLVLIPPIHEQLSIVKYLDNKIAKVNNSISTIRKECALYKEYKQSLISEVVTGKRKVID